MGVRFAQMTRCFTDRPELGGDPSRIGRRPDVPDRRRAHRRHRMARHTLEDRIELQRPTGLAIEIEKPHESIRRRTVRTLLVHRGSRAQEVVEAGNEDQGEGHPHRGP